MEINVLNRNIGLDIVKGICIILMVVGHSGSPKWLHDCIYMFHMPCFFIVSGYLFKGKYVNDTKGFLKRKMITLWKPFVIWSLVYILLHNLFGTIHFYEDTYTLKDQLIYGFRSLILRESEMLLGGFWFISCLFCASVVSILFYKYIGISSKQLLGGILFFLLLTLALKDYNINIWHINSLTCLSVVYFMTGTALKTISITSYKMRRLVVISAILFLGCFTFYWPGEMPMLTVNQVIPYYLVSSLVSWALILICTQVNYFSPMVWLAKVGGRSMDILIFHFLAFKLGSLLLIVYYGHPITFLSQFPIISSNNDWHWLVYTIIGIGVSLLIGEVIILIKINCVRMENNIRNRWHKKRNTSY